MKKLVSIPFLALALTWSVQALDEVSMVGPAVKATPEAIHLTVYLSSFVPGDNYRIGVGASGQELSGVEFKFLKAETPLPKKPVSFNQEYAQLHFGVEKIAMRGFLLESGQLPDPGDVLTLKVKIPRAEAEKSGKVFLIIAKKYGLDLWYIVDGAEVDQSYW